MLVLPSMSSSNKQSIVCCIAGVVWDACLFLVVATLLGKRIWVSMLLHARKNVCDVVPLGGLHDMGLKC